MFASSLSRRFVVSDMWLVYDCLTYDRTTSLSPPKFHSMNRFLALFFLSQLHSHPSKPAVALGEIPPRNWDLPASLPALSRSHATAAPRRSSVAETARIFARLLQDVPAARSQRLLHQVHRSQRTAVFVQGKLLNGLLERTGQMSKTVFRKKPI